MSLQITACRRLLTLGKTSNPSKQGQFKQLFIFPPLLTYGTARLKSTRVRMEYRPLLACGTVISLSFIPRN